MAKQSLSSWATITSDIFTARESRKEPRHVVHFKSALECPQGSASRALILDISRSGMRLMTGCDLKLGDKVGVCLLDGSKASGLVVRQADVQIGIEFSEPISSSTVSAIRLASLPPNSDALARPDREETIAATSTKNRPVTNADLIWIAPLWVAIKVWFFLVDAYFAISDVFGRNR